MVKYCLPIIEGGTEEAAARIREQAGFFDYFEVWLDYLEDYRSEWLEQLGRDWGGRLVLLLRRQGLEPIRMAREERQRVLELAAACGCYLDLDSESQAEDLALLSALHARPAVILSYHNYRETPPLEDLQRIRQRMALHSPAIFKFSCLCSGPEDALRLLELQAGFRGRQERHIVLGMGEFGAVTRIFGTLWGNEFVFAPLDRATASAPGQLTRAELEGIFEVLARGFNRPL